MRAKKRDHNAKVLLDLRLLQTGGYHGNAVRWHCKQRKSIQPSFDMLHWGPALSAHFLLRHTSMNEVFYYIYIYGRIASYHSSSLIHENWDATTKENSFLTHREKVLFKFRKSFFNFISSIRSKNTFRTKINSNPYHYKLKFPLMSKQKYRWQKYRIGIHSDICIRPNANHSESIQKTFCISFVEKRPKIDPT